MTSGAAGTGKGGGELVTLTDAGGRVLAELSLRDGALNGPARWYDGSGALVAEGEFRDGRPFDGTFVNWTRGIPGMDGADPWTLEFQCRDWVATFESFFFSVRPKYDMVVEQYRDGRPLEPQG